MKHQVENQGKDRAWEDLTTRELDDLLARDFAAGQEGLLDPAAILAITEVINSRETDTPTDADVQAAWERFRDQVREKEEGPEEAPAEPVPLPAKPRRPRKLPWAISAAAVVCVLVCILVVPASGKDLWESLVDWTVETFSFKNSTVADSGLDEAMFIQLEEAVAEQTDLPVLPAWYPEGTTLTDISVEDNSFATTLTAWFDRNQQEFSFVIRISKDGEIPSGEYEKDEGAVETYYAAEIPHYIMSNMGYHTAAWRIENVECFIQGHLTTEELKAMIDSIYG